MDLKITVENEYQKNEIIEIFKNAYEYGYFHSVDSEYVSFLKSKINFSISSFSFGELILFCMEKGQESPLELCDCFAIGLSDSFVSISTGSYPTDYNGFYHTPYSSTPVNSNNNHYYYARMMSNRRN